MAVSIPGNQRHIDDLKNAIQAGRLVAIIGTGVSIQIAKPLELDGFKVATWKGLLRHGVLRCQTLNLIAQTDADHLNTLIGWDNIDHLIHAAEVITKMLIGSAIGTYQQWLEDTVGQLEVDDPRLINALVNISAIIGSLNYDTLPEKVTARASVSWNQPHLVSAIVNGKLVEEAGQKRQGIIHLHGCWRDATSVVLGTASYNQVSNHPHAQG